METAGTQRQGAEYSASVWRSPIVFLVVMFLLSWSYAVTYRLFPTAQWLGQFRLFIKDPNVPSAIVLPLLTVVGILWLQRLHFRTPPSPALMLYGATLLALPLFFLPPEGSRDVFSYGYYGNLQLRYHENPYTVAKDAPVRDAFFSATKSPVVFQTNYGPLWTAFEPAVVWLTRGSVQAAGLMFRIVAVMSFLFCITLLTRMTNETLPTTRLLLFVWNPYVLFEVANNGHNDITMMMLVLAGFWALFYKKYVWAIIAIIGAALTKFVPFLLLPFFFLALWKAIDHHFQRWKMMGLGGIVAVALTIVAFVPYWQGLKTLRLAFDLSASINLPLYHPVVWVFRAVQWALRVEVPQAAIILHSALVALYLLGYAGLLVRFLRRKTSDVIPSALLVLVGFLLLGMLYFQPWYFLWLLPLLPLWRSAHAPRAAILLSVLGAITYAVF